LLSSSAGATSYGATSLRFEGKGTGTTKGHPFELEQETHAFGVDTVDNSIYVGDAKSESSEEEYRLQKYDGSGAFEGEVIVKPAKKELPKGIEYVEGLDGVAIDHFKERVYLLVTYKRASEDSVDPSLEVAGALYAYSTTPSGHKLVPAPGTNSEGLLASSEMLHAESETQGEALLRPSGIAVDPKTHEVMILGEVDDGGGNSGLHLALDRLSEGGSASGRYVDSSQVLGHGEEPTSPVVSGNGRVFIEGQNAIQEIPTSFTGAPKTLFHFEEPESLVEEGPFKEEILAFGEETISGGGLSIVSEGADTEGRLALMSEVQEIAEDGEVKEKPWGVLNLHYSEVGSETKVSELGWTGGGPDELASEGACAIGFEGNYPQVGATTGDEDIVLAPSSGEVLSFGPGGSGCPAAKVGSGGIEATLEGKKDSEVTTKTPVVLQAKVVQGNVQSVEWKFGDGSSSQTVQVPVGEQIQTAEVEHKFAKGGNLTVEAVIHTDDLTTPVLTASTVLTVSEGIEVKTQPAPRKVLEGETATFEATAQGSTSVHWEESPNGSTWTTIAGATSDKLEVKSAKASENGYEYRAVFENAKGAKAVSNPAKLSVETIAQHEEKLEQEQREREKAANEKKILEQKVEEERRQAAELQATEAAAKAAAEKAAAEKAAAEKAAAEVAAKKQIEETALAHTAVVGGTSLTVSSSGAITIKLSCPGAVSSCTGSVTLRTLKAVIARHAKASILTLGSGTFTVAGGQAKAITLHLSSAALKVLARSHVLQARATIVVRNPATGGSHTTQFTLTLRPAKRKHR
jgi:hypothetical protein